MEIVGALQRLGFAEYEARAYPDGAEVVAGEIGAAGETHGVRTRQPLLVDMCSSAVRTSSALIACADPLGDADSFFERMRALRFAPEP